MLCCMADNRPTTKGIRLGRTLREARESTGISLTAFAEQIGIDKGQLSKIENGKTRKPPTEQDVARILGGLGINGDEYERIMAMARGADAAQWTATTLPDRELMNSAVIDAEAAAAAITVSALVLFPGLIQDPSYARAIMSAGTVPREEVSTRVAVRMGRTSVIDPNRTDHPAKFTALIDEAAFRRQVGGPKVMIQQLKYLRDRVATWENVNLHVIPNEAGWYPGTSGAFSLIEPREPDGLTIVYLENRRSGQLLHADEDVAAYRDAVNAGLRAAMNPSDTSEFIAAVIEEMRK